jgi:nicotinamidase/pyrazinamidase
MRKILVVVDMQNDFIDQALGTKEAQAIVAPVCAKIRSYPRENVIATRDTHPLDYLETNEGRHLPVPHCIKGTAGWQLNDKVQQALGGARVIDKPTFGSVELAEELRKMNAEEPIAVELVGLCTDICVISNALLIKAFLPEIEVSVDPACCAGVTPESHEAALKTMASCQIQLRPQEG